MRDEVVLNLNPAFCIYSLPAPSLLRKEEVLKYSEIFQFVRNA
jgi:hypothetical protein